MARYGLTKCPMFAENGDAYETSPFGTRTLNGKTTKHLGVDIVRYAGYNTTATIVAPAAGKITAVKNTVTGTDHSKNLEGNYVVIDHGNGMVSKYFHLKHGSIPLTIRVGAQVKVGDKIGFMGNTGDSYGAHLHFQLEQNGQPIDGAPYLKGVKQIVNSLENDLAVLVKRGIINSPEYWRGQAATVRYLPDLLHNMAEVLK